MRTKKLKKLLAVALAVAMTLALSGCMLTLVETDIKEDGSGTLVMRSGYSEEGLAAMEDEDTAEQIAAIRAGDSFMYNGEKYYGDSESYTFANVDELNAILNASDEEDEEAEAEEGMFAVTKNADGTFTLTIVVPKTEEEELPDEISEEISEDLSEELAGELEEAISEEDAEELAEMAANSFSTIMEFTFPAAVTQQQGPTEAVTIEGNKLVLDVMKFAEDPTYVFKTGAKAPVIVKSPQKLSVNGELKETEIYNIDGTNFFKLRDLAALLNGTPYQFNVDYDKAANAIVVKTKTPYTTANGGELKTGVDNSSKAVRSAQSLLIDGKAVDLEAYNIGGTNFFGLRALEPYIGYTVGYDSATNTATITSK
jgi:hypothetical protein